MIQPKLFRHRHHFSFHMKTIYFVTFTILSLDLFPYICHASDEMFPPSRYIGLYDEYLGHQNGKLPDTNQTYTGVWSYIENATLLLDGEYTNGIPAGTWKEYSDGGIVRRQCEYSDNNAFTETVFWPNGTPRLKITGKCFWQPKSVHREIHSITRMDGSKQIEKFPEKRIAVSHYFKNNEYDELKFDKFHEAYMMFQNNEFRLHTFQQGLNSSEWEYDFIDGTVDWKNKTLEIQNPRPDFPYQISIGSGDVQCVYLATPWKSRDSFNMPKGNTALTREYSNSQNDSEYPVLYITERHRLADYGFTNLETGDFEEIPFQITVSGFYIPGMGWSDVLVESTGSFRYLLNNPVIINNAEEMLDYNIDTPLFSGAMLLCNYWGTNSRQLKKPHDSFHHEILITYQIFANYNINLPDKNLYNFKTGRSFKLKLKVISFDKYRDRLLFQSKSQK